MQDTRYARRNFLTLVGACIMTFSTACKATTSPSKSEANQLNVTQPAQEQKPLAKAAMLVKVKEKWSADELYEFLNALPNEGLLSIKKSLGLVNENAGIDALQGKSKDVRDIQKQALWISSNILAYPFRDETVLNYHSLASWVASDIGVTPELIAKESTFILERAIEKQLFAQLWDKLKVEQREELLNKIDPNGKIKDRAAITALSGAGALGALSATVAFTGFTFYTTMSVAISTAAGFLGLTLPFAAYTGASSLVAFLSGPIGWAIAGIATLGGIALTGRANVKKTTAFICQVHSLKVAALIEAGISEKEVFGE